MRFFIRRLSLLLVGVCLSYGLEPVALAQEGTLDQVVVTGVRLDSDEYGDRGSKPHISKRVRADLVMMELSVVSGTIDRNERETELRQMFDRIVETVSAAEGISLTAGTFGDRYAIETTRVADIWRHYGNSGSFSLVLQIDAKANERFEDVYERGEDFVFDIEPVGRAQFDFGEEEYIGLRNLGRHRLDLLEAINKDVGRLREIFSASLIEVSGLEEQIVTRPVDEMVLELYIPYHIGLTIE